VKPADPARVVAAARGWLGTPYHDQASRRGAGCDCLGLVRGVWREVVGAEPLEVPPYSRDWGEVGGVEVLHEAAAQVMLPADPARLKPGALLLFRMRRGAIAKRCGILTERATFIHAYERLGVIEEPLTGAWRRRIAFAHMFPGHCASGSQDPNIAASFDRPATDPKSLRHSLEGPSAMCDVLSCSRSHAKKSCHPPWIWIPAVQVEPAAVEHRHREGLNGDDFIQVGLRR
jgi:NlpC/P60 family putative phage cell wall peptidase